MKFPENPDQSFAKRLVAGPGDTIEERAGRLVVNGKPLPACLVGRYAVTDGDRTSSGDLVLEKSEAGAYLIFDASGGAAAPGGPWQMGANEWFVVGDNRRNSHDSRSWNDGRGRGLPEPMLVGRVEMPPLALPVGGEGLAPGLSKCKAELGVP